MSNSIKRSAKRMAEERYQKQQAFNAEIMKTKFGLMFGREICKKRAWRFFCIISIIGNILFIMRMILSK